MSVLPPLADINDTAEMAVQIVSAAQSTDDDIMQQETMESSTSISHDTLDKPSTSIDCDVTISQPSLNSPISDESLDKIIINASASKPPIPASVTISTISGEITVELVREYLSTRRPFLGGFRSKPSNRIKLNASTQTEARRNQIVAHKSERSTQTVASVTRSQQTMSNASTQMDRRDLCMINDPTANKIRVLEAKEAVSADSIEALRDMNARSIQCWLRVCFAHRRLEQMRKIREEGSIVAERNAAHKVALHDAQQRLQIARRMKPQTSADFSLLHQELQAWRQHETQRIRSLGLSTEEQDKQLATLLSKEVKLLQTIDRLKLAATKQKGLKDVATRLTAMSSPFEWSASTGAKVQVITPDIERAKELVSLYHALQLPFQALPVHPTEEKSAAAASTGPKQFVDWPERLDILLNVKYTVREQGGNPSRGSVELLQLIEREEEWMRRRIKTHAAAIEKVDSQGQCLIMLGLRKRIASLFLEFMDNPLVNPNSQRFPK